MDVQGGCAPSHALGQDGLLSAAKEGAALCPAGVRGRTLEADRHPRGGAAGEAQSKGGKVEGARGRRELHGCGGAAGVRRMGDKKCGQGRTLSTISISISNISTSCTRRAGGAAALQLPMAHVLSAGRKCPARVNMMQVGQAGDGQLRRRPWEGVWDCNRQPWASGLAEKAPLAWGLN